MSVLLCLRVRERLQEPQTLVDIVSELRCQSGGSRSWNWPIVVAEPAVSELHRGVEALFPAQATEGTSTEWLL
ncbi:Uncharacterized protein HZ326_12195 [Fusarium oxysporum f. sp. albedinis]|nr:Uncharacterized protein HZ326_12195 [Fusarium oxysporum f. sp. albedinis]